MGQVTGYYNSCVVGPQVSFAWSQEIGFQVLTSPPGITGAKAYDINNVLGTGGIGQIVVELDPSDTPNRAFLLSDGEWLNLGTLPDAAISVAEAVNDMSTVVGQANHPATGFFKAFVWQDGVMDELAALAGPRNAAEDINSAGQITGWMGTAPNTDGVAFIWDDGVVTALPPIPGGTTSEGRAINVHGDVAGRGKYFDPEWNDDVWRGFAYIDGEMTRIDPLPAFKNCTTYDINSSGQAVGYMETFESRAMLWENGNTYDLNHLVPPGTPTLRSARAIDDDGRIVATAWVTLAVLLSPLPVATGDVNCDGLVNVTDLLILLGSWGPCEDPGTCNADLDGDGAVGVTDLLILLANWA